MSTILKQEDPEYVSSTTHYQEYPEEVSSITEIQVWPGLSSTNQKQEDPENASSLLQEQVFPENEQSTSKQDTDIKVPYKCKFCGFESKCSKWFRSHRKRHVTEKFEKIKYAYRNGKSACQDSGVTLYYCNRCEFKCTQQTSLTTHMKTHQGQVAFKCNFCERNFATLAHLHGHEKTHKLELIKNCNMKGCVCLSIVNTREKPYKCDVCNYKYACLKNLTFHKRMHGEKQTSSWH